jgi:soluble lytic murein transglycosylase-like protein
MDIDPVMKSPSQFRRCLALLAAFATVCTPAFAAEHITLRNGSEFDCVRQEAAGDHVRLYLFPAAHAAASHDAGDDANYIEVAANSVVRVETVPDPLVLTAVSPLDPARTASLTAAEMREMLTRAGTLHNIDADLLASVVQAESAGNPLAVSRAGARGLMQLMPSTASGLGVHNSFAPEQNIGGGTAYLDQLLTRYRDNIVLALAAYNAGPAAVDRYHGIPPYAETRAYVARVIRAFNRRKLAAASGLGIIATAHE